jgi:hypothetical protein
MKIYPDTAAVHGMVNKELNITAGSRPNENRPGMKWVNPATMDVIKIAGQGPVKSSSVVWIKPL